MNGQLVVELWHVASALGGLVMLWIGYDRHYNAPVRKWRGEKDVADALRDAHLANGAKRMEKLEAKDKELNESVQGLRNEVHQTNVTLARIETLLKGAVLKGVGDAAP